MGGGVPEYRRCFWRFAKRTHFGPLGQTSGHHGRGRHFYRGLRGLRTGSQCQHSDYRPSVAGCGDWRNNADCAGLRRGTGPGIPSRRTGIAVPARLFTWTAAGFLCGI